MAHVISYISKEDQTLPGNLTGQYWGILNRAHLPTVPATTYEVTDRQAVQINRWKRTLTRKYQEQARWNTWAKLWKQLPGKWHWFSRTEFEYAWTHRNRPRRCAIDIQTSTGCFLLPISSLLPAMSLTDDSRKLRPPRRVRMWNNSGGALLCNASGFWEAVQRGIELGVI